MCKCAYHDNSVCLLDARLRTRSGSQYLVTPILFVVERDCRRAAEAEQARPRANTAPLPCVLRTVVDETPPRRKRLTAASGFDRGERKVLTFTMSGRTGCVRPGFHPGSTRCWSSTPSISQHRSTTGNGHSSSTHDPPTPRNPTLLPHAQPPDDTLHSAELCIRQSGWHGPTADPIAHAQHPRCVSNLSAFAG